MSVRLIRTCLVSFAMFFALGAAPALASTHTWTGPASGVWSNAANWSGGVPTSGEPGGTIVVFGTSTTTTMDIAGLTVDEIHFTAGGNSILGSAALGVTGSNVLNNIVSDAGTNTVAPPLTFSGSTVFASVAAGVLTLSGSIGGVNGFHVAGAGQVTLSGASNTYTGTTTVATGTLALNSSGSNTAVTGALIVVGSGPGSPATLKLLQSIEIGDATNVQVAAGSTFDLGSFSESIQGLAITDGTVAIGTGSLIVNGPLGMSGGAITGTSPGVLRLLGDVTASSSATSAATISSLVFLNGARTFTVADGPQPTDLGISNGIADGVTPSSLTKAGAGTMSITGSTGDTYTGNTVVQSGILTTSHSVGVGIPANVTIGTGAGGPSSATLRLDQSSELPPTSNVTVQQDGLFNVNGFQQVLGALTVHGGAVAIGAGALTVAGPIGMSGGSIDSTSTGRLNLGGDVTATSSAQGSATISAHETLTGDRTFVVTPGTAPELTLSGPIGEQSGARALTKAGAGTLLSTGNHTYTGLTTVAGGRFDVRGQQTGPFAVAAGGTLTGTGAIGATTVAGVLAPEDGLRTGALSFGAGGQLVVHLASADPAEAPTTTVTGAVTIDPAAVLSVTVAPGLTLPGGTALPLIATGAAAAGAFSAPPLSSPEGVPLVPTYTATGVALTASNVAPAVGSISAAPTTATVGQPFALSVGSSDLNNDALTTTWDFGDGTAATGASTSHGYAAAGTYHVVATVSDGAVKTTATTDVTVTQPAGGGGGATPTPTGGGSVTATGFGATFGLTAPSACVRPGGTFTATLAIKRLKGKKNLIASVTRVVFSAGGKSTKTDRTSPYRVLLTLPKATHGVSARAYLKLRSGANATKTLKLAVRVCA